MVHGVHSLASTHTPPQVAAVEQKCIVTESCKLESRMFLFPLTLISAVDLSVVYTCKYARLATQQRDVLATSASVQ